MAKSFDELVTLSLKFDYTVYSQVDGLDRVRLAFLDTLNPFLDELSTMYNIDRKQLVADIKCSRKKNPSYYAYKSRVIDPCSHVSRDGIGCTTNKTVNGSGLCKKHFNAKKKQSNRPKKDKKKSPNIDEKSELGNIQLEDWVVDAQYKCHPSTRFVIRVEKNKDKDSNDDEKYVVIGKDINKVLTALNPRDEKKCKQFGWEYDNSICGDKKGINDDTTKEVKNTKDFSEKISKLSTMFDELSDDDMSDEDED